MTSLIDIGKEKQLFLDEYLVERITGAKQILHPPQKAGPDPIIPADRPWEGNFGKFLLVKCSKIQGGMRCTGQIAVASAVGGPVSSLPTDLGFH